MAPAVGKTVLFKFGTEEKPVIRPGVILHVWSGDCVNLAVLPDGTNDGAKVDWSGQNDPVVGAGHVGFWWVTSVSRGDGLRQWNWPPE